MRKIVSAGDCLGTVEVVGGQSKTVELLALEDFSYALASEENPTVRVSGPGFVYAPVAQGQSAGVAHIMLGDTPVGKVSLIYGQTVELEPEREKPAPFWKQWFGGQEP